jgi:DNA-binding FadR family transcriptional regulator
MAAKGRLVLYQETAAVIRARIAAGELAPGDRVGASLGELRRQHGVSVGTMRAALDLLVAEGLVETLQGKGTFVAKRASVAEEASGPDAALAARVAAVEGRVDAAEDRIGEGEKRAGAAGRRVLAAEDRVRTMAERIAGAEERIADLDARIMDLYARLGWPDPGRREGSADEQRDEHHPAGALPA